MIAGTDRTWTVDDATRANVTLDLAGSRVAVPLVRTDRAEALAKDATAFRWPPLTPRPAAHVRHVMRLGGRAPRR